MNTYEKIEAVLRSVGRPLAPHEFEDVKVPSTDWPHHEVDGRYFVGQSESTLSRRMREMRKDGRLTAQRRAGKTFVEYALVPKCDCGFVDGGHEPDCAGSPFMLAANAAPKER